MKAAKQKSNISVASPLTMLIKNLSKTQVIADQASVYLQTSLSADLRKSSSVSLNSNKDISKSISQLTDSKAMDEMDTFEKSEKEVSYLLEENAVLKRRLSDLVEEESHLKDMLKAKSHLKCSLFNLLFNQSMIENELEQRNSREISVVSSSVRKSELEQRIEIVSSMSASTPLLADVPVEAGLETEIVNEYAIKTSGNESEPDKLGALADLSRKKSVKHRQPSISEVPNVAPIPEDMADYMSEDKCKESSRKLVEKAPEEDCSKENSDEFPLNISVICAPLENYAFVTCRDESSLAQDSSLIDKHGVSRLSLELPSKIHFDVQLNNHESFSGNDTREEITVATKSESADAEVDVPGAPFSNEAGTHLNFSKGENFTQDSEQIESVDKAYYATGNKGDSQPKAIDTVLNLDPKEENGAAKEEKPIIVKPKPMLGRSLSMVKRNQALFESKTNPKPKVMPTTIPEVPQKGIKELQQAKIVSKFSHMFEDKAASPRGSKEMIAAPLFLESTQTPTSATVALHRSKTSATRRFESKEGSDKPPLITALKPSLPK